MSAWLGHHVLMFGIAKLDRPKQISSIFSLICKYSLHLLHLTETLLSKDTAPCNPPVHSCSQVCHRLCGGCPSFSSLLPDYFSPSCLPQLPVFSLFTLYLVLLVHSAAIYASLGPSPSFLEDFYLQLTATLWSNSLFQYPSWSSNGQASWFLDFSSSNFHVIFP